MQDNTEKNRKAQRRKVIRTTLLCAAVLVTAAVVTIWAQRTFWPEGILAEMLPYTALLYLLLLPALGICLKRRLERIDREEDEHADRQH